MKGQNLERLCVSCGGYFRKDALIKVIAREGVLRIDHEGRAEGRSAYVCKDPACILKAVRKRLLKRSMKSGDDRELNAELERMTHD